MTLYQLGQYLRQRRESLDLRQQDLSELSGVTIKTIHLIEAGTGNPSVATLEKLVEILGLEILLQIKKLD